MDAITAYVDNDKVSLSDSQNYLSKIEVQRNIDALNAEINSMAMQRGSGFADFFAKMLMLFLLFSNTSTF